MRNPFSPLDGSDGKSVKTRILIHSLLPLTRLTNLISFLCTLAMSTSK